MQANKQIIKEWKQYYEHGDLTKVAIEISNQSKKDFRTVRVSVSRAWGTGIMNEQIFEAFKIYYKNKAIVVKQRHKEVIEDCN